MRLLKILGRIFLFLFLAIAFFFTASVYEGYKRNQSIKETNGDINTWHKERDEVYDMEELAFTGIVQSKSPGLHRHDIDTLTISLNQWVSMDTSFSGDYYLKRISDSLLLLFVNYSEALYPPNAIEVGDSIAKNRFSFDFTVYSKNKQPRKTLSLLFCSYENPDTIIHKGDFMFGTYETYFQNQDTLFSGMLTNGKRQGEWRYYKAHADRYKILEGPYHDNKREGVFRKYYERTNQLMYEETYQTNMPNGQFTWWYSNGQVESKRFYEHGKPKGTSEFYNDAGKLIKKEQYH